MTNRYLEKVAKEYYQQTVVPDDRIGTTAGVAIAGAITSQQAHSRLSKLLGQYVQGHDLHKPNKYYNAVHRLSGTPAAVLGGAALASERTRDYAWALPIVTTLPAVIAEARSGGGKALLSRNMANHVLPNLFSSAGIAGVNYLRRAGEEVHPDEWVKESAYSSGKTGRVLLEPGVEYDLGKHDLVLSRQVVADYLKKKENTNRMYISILPALYGSVAGVASVNALAKKFVGNRKVSHLHNGVGAAIGAVGVGALRASLYSIPKTDLPTYKSDLISSLESKYEDEINRVEGWV